MAKSAVCTKGGTEVGPRLAPVVMSFKTKRLKIVKISSAEQLIDLKKFTGQYHVYADPVEYYAYLTNNGYFTLESSFGYFAVFLGEEPIGYLELSFNNDSGTAEICRYLSAMHQGHGYGVEITQGVRENIIDPSVGKMVSYIDAPYPKSHGEYVEIVELKESGTLFKHLINEVEITNYPSLSSCFKSGMVPHVVAGNIVISTYPAVDAPIAGVTLTDDIKVISKFLAGEAICHDTVVVSIENIIICKEPITALAMIPRLEYHFTYNELPELRTQLIELIESYHGHLQSMLNLLPKAIANVQEEYSGICLMAFTSLLGSLTHLQEIIDPSSDVCVAKYDAALVAAQEAMFKKYNDGSNGSIAEVVVCDAITTSSAVVDLATPPPEVMVCIGGPVDAAVEPVALH